MSTLPPSQPMPHHVAQALRKEFEQLPPPAARFRCDAGRRFLGILREHCATYGAKQVADAIGMSISSVYQMRYREPARRIYGYPTEEQMRPVRTAWAAILARRAEGRQIRQTTEQFRTMQHVIVQLCRQINTDVVMIAVALGVEPSQLRVFVEKKLPRPRPRRQT